MSGGMNWSCFVGTVPSPQGLHLMSRQSRSGEQLLSLLFGLLFSQSHVLKGRSEWHESCASA